MINKQELSKKIKNNRRGDQWSPSGITLVALVVTIIILLILAGIAINLSIGENGLFERAKQAKDKYANYVRFYINGNTVYNNSGNNNFSFNISVSLDAYDDKEVVIKMEAGGNHNPIIINITELIMNTSSI